MHLGLEMDTTSFEWLVLSVLAGCLAFGLLFIWIEKRGPRGYLRQLANEYEGKVCRDRAYLGNYLCSFRRNIRDYYVTYRPIPGEGSDGGDQLLIVCKVNTPFEFIISTDRTPWWHRIGKYSFEHWPQVLIPAMDSRLIVRTPAEAIVRSWLQLDTVNQAVARLMNEVNQILARKDELQVARFLDGRDPDLAMIKGWVSQIDLIADTLNDPDKPPARHAPRNGS
jgi:hypothetical protein